MHGTWIIFRREVMQFFTSPISYLIGAAFLFLTGFLFNNDVAVSIGTRAVSPALIPSFLSFLLMIFAPLLTMRLLAEESREGTLELLLTAPVSDTAIVMGKFLAAWFYYTLLLAATWAYQFILVFYLDAQPDLGHTISAYIGIWLYGGATLTVGLLFSAITENQILAAFLSTATLLLLYLGGLATQIISNLDLVRIIDKLTLQGHFTGSFLVGLVRAEDVVYYAGLIFVFLYITIRVVESRRWRG